MGLRRRINAVVAWIPYSLEEAATSHPVVLNQHRVARGRTGTASVYCGIAGLTVTDSSDTAAVIPGLAVPVPEWLPQYIEIDRKSENGCDYRG